MYVPERLVTSFNMKLDNKCYESDIQDVLIVMHVDIEAKALFKRKKLSEYWSSINTASKYR